MKQIAVQLVPGHALGGRLVGKGITLKMDGGDRFIWCEEIESIGEGFPVEVPLPDPPAAPEHEPLAKKFQKKHRKED